MHGAGCGEVVITAAWYRTDTRCSGFRSQTNVGRAESPEPAVMATPSSMTFIAGSGLS